MGGLIQRRELHELLHSLDSPDCRGVFVLGDPGMGKSLLLQQAAAELARRGRAAFVVELQSYQGTEDLASWILSEIRPAIPDLPDAGRTIRASGGRELQNGAASLNGAAHQLQAPVLLLDGLDASPYPPNRFASAVEALSRLLDRWILVVASRPALGIDEARRFPRFDLLQLGPLTDTEALVLIRGSNPDLTEDAVREVLTQANGHPLFLGLAARFAKGGVAFAGLHAMMESVVANAVDGSQDPITLSTLLDELALAGGRDRISALAGKLRIAEDQVRLLIDPLCTAGVLREHSDGSVAFFHALARELVLTQRVFQGPFRLTDLRFGAEEAERDDQLDASFVGRHSLDRILNERRSIVIGDRGSGKSAIFRRLAENQSIETIPIANAGDLLHRIVDMDAWQDADALRAAWLVVIAAVAAMSVSAGEAPKALRRNATDLRSALGLPIVSPGRPQRVTRSVGRILGGTTLKFGIGPVSFETKLPPGTRSSSSFLDIESLLQETDQLLRRADRRVVVLLDRIDETFKYDRGKQEAVVQALLQAEARMSRLDSIELVVFLRTDLFELYDIQEKNKLVSRSLVLEWSEEDWLRVLIRRVFANEPLARLGHRLHVDNESIEMRAALEVLLPSEIEGEAVDRWLIESLRNGNGDISPRLAVLLLHLARDRSVSPDEFVSTVPLFSADAVQRAMTRLSELSFSEVVNDFKVAPTFVLNCRAGKLITFTLPEVETLFDVAEGKTGDQVRLLERLGYLERVVEQQGTQTTSRFRIPRLYTRCWDYA